MSLRYDCYKRVAARHAPTAFFCEYLFYAVQILCERPKFALVSYPKCGRTWIHFMLMRYFAVRFEAEERERLIAMARRDGRIPKTVLTHDGKCVRFWNRNKATYRSTSVIFLARDPRDAIVSHYKHCRFRDGTFSADLSSFIRHPHYGLGEIIRFMNHWKNASAIPEAFYLCRYEDFKADTKRTLVDLLEFMGESPTDEKALAQTLADGSIDAMREREKSGSGGLSGLERTDGTTDSMKVRQGKIGAYRNAMNDDDIRFVDHLVETELNPDFGYR